MNRRPLYSDLADEAGFGPKRRIREADLDITPMIDVTFLLLIFFMVTSTMQGTPEVDVPPAQFGLGVEKEHATVITVKAPNSPEERPEVELPGGRAATLDQVRAEIESAVQGGRMRTMIRADREVPHGFVQEVIKTVDSVEGVEFYVEVRDPKSR